MAGSKKLTATIAVSGTTSNALDIKNWTPVGMVLPSSFDGTTITFTASDSEGGTYVPVYDKTGTQISYTVAASRAIKIVPEDLAGFEFIKLVAGSSQTTTDTEITLVLKAL